MAGVIRVIDQRGVLINSWKRRDAEKYAKNRGGRFISIRRAAALATQTAQELLQQGHPCADWMVRVAEDFRRSAALCPREQLLQLPIYADVEVCAGKKSSHDAIRDLLGLVADGTEKKSAYALRVGGSPVPPEAWAYVRRRLHRAKRKLQRRGMWREARRQYVEQYPGEY